MPRRRSPDEDEALLRARGTHPSSRATDQRFGDDQKLVQVFPPWLEPFAGSLGKQTVMPDIETMTEAGTTSQPWVKPNVPPVVVPKPQSRRRGRLPYRAAFRPDFFPYSAKGYSAGEQRAVKLRDMATTIWWEGYRSAAVLIAEHQDAYSGSRFLVAGINGTFNDQQHAMLDQLRIMYRYGQRSETDHPDVVIAFGQIEGQFGPIDSTSTAIGSSIRFCDVCLRRITGAGFVVIPDVDPFKASASPPPSRARGV